MSVTNAGVATGVAVGAASITAHYNAIASSAVSITAAAASVAHPNEPAGFAMLSPVLTGDIVPPTQDAYVAGSANDIGWINNGGVQKATDPTSPVDSTSVLKLAFPAGFPGGSAPGSCFTYQFPNNPQNWPSNPRQLYQSYWYKVSPNFPANLNANKMVYSNIGGGNKAYTDFGGIADYKLVNGSVVLAPGQATPYDSALFLFVEVQDIVRLDATVEASVRLNPNTVGDPTLWRMLMRGQWHHIETLYVANTAGNNDGGVRCWIDGFLTIDYLNRIQWSTGADNWDWTTWLPVYGGGGQVPGDAVNAYHEIKNFYTSGL